jgi:hypothetical protein
MREHGEISKDVFKSFSENTSTPSGGDDLKGIKRRRLNISTSLISTQKGSGRFTPRLRLYVQNGSSFEKCL